MTGLRLSRTQGWFYVVGGLWPLLHMPSFEAVFGPKIDRWLVRTVAGLLVANGLTQLATEDDAFSVRQSRRLGLGTAAALAAIDLYYVPRHRIRRTYLLDAVAEVGFILAWARRGDPISTGRKHDHG